MYKGFERCAFCSNECSYQSVPPRAHSYSSHKSLQEDRTYRPCSPQEGGLTFRSRNGEGEGEVGGGVVREKIKERESTYPLWHLATIWVMMVVL